MSRIPDYVRRLVVEWPADAPHGAVAQFCREHGVSERWFYSVRKRVAQEGEAAAVKRSTRPRTSPKRIADVYSKSILAQRERLRDEGKDYGPISIQTSLIRSGLPGVPSRATIARVLDANHVTDRNKRKRPKASHRRFQSTFANERWQSDAFTVELSTGEEYTVIEIIDDATRFNLGVTIADAENGIEVLGAFKLAFEEYGRPVVVHTDNGSAYNLDRVGLTTQFVAFLRGLGIRTITGRPNHPKSQGKVERAHQTLQRFLDARDLHTRAELEAAAAEYRQWYNHDRAHQALGNNTTPAEAYATRPRMAPPEMPVASRVRLNPPAAVSPGGVIPQTDAEVIKTRQARGHGIVGYRYMKFGLGDRWEGQTIRVLEHPELLEFFDSQGTLIACSHWPLSGKQMVGLAAQTMHHEPPPLPEPE